VLDWPICPTNWYSTGNLQHATVQEVFCSILAVSLNQILREAGHDDAQRV
jgi:hypothetical protein